MQQGRESQTAVMVCMARAAAHGASEVPRYSDPTAIALLPDEERRKVEALHSGAKPKNLREGMARAMLERRLQWVIEGAVERHRRAGAVAPRGRLSLE